MTRDCFAADYSVEVGGDWVASASVSVEEVPGNGLHVTIDTMSRPDLSRQMENAYIAKMTTRSLADAARGAGRRSAGSS